MECKKHKTYQGVRAPKDCADCWKIYFETDTEKKKKKYPEEYEQYCKPPKKDISVKKESLPNEPKVELNGEVTIQIPIKLSKYYWSETLQTSVKVTGYVPQTDMVLLHVDMVKVVPRSEIESLRLFPYSVDGFVLRTKKKVLSDNTMTVFVDKVNQDVLKTKTPRECDHEVDCAIWESGQQLTIEEDGPSHILKHDETGEYPVLNEESAEPKSPKKKSKKNSEEEPVKKRGKTKVKVK